MEKIVEKLKDIILVENDKLRQEFKETISQENDKLRQEFKETIGEETGKLRQEMNQKFDDVQQQMNGLCQEVNKNMNDLAKEILDRQFVFENDYGTKINAIYEYVQFHQEKNLQRFDRITNIEQRVDEIELHNFDHEKRISILERRKV